MEKISIAYTGHRPKGLPGGGNYHSDDNIKLKNVLRAVTFEIYKELVKDEDTLLRCIGGGASGTDTLALDNCLYLKARYPSKVEIVVASPFRDFDYGRSGTWAYVHDNIKKNCDSLVYVDELEEYAIVGVEPKRYDVRKYTMRDRYMVDKCDILIAVLNKRLEHLRSGSMATYVYAKGRKDIILVDVHARNVTYVPSGESSIGEVLSKIVNKINEGEGLV